MVVIGVLVVLVLGFAYLSTYSPIQKVTAPKPTPIPPFSLVLSTSTPTVDIPVHQQSTDFELTLTQNGNRNLQFPCTVNLYSPSNEYGSSLNLIGYQVMNGYGSQQYSIDYFTASVAGFEGHYVTFYATVTDAYGVTITSNTVTVEYYGNGLSPNK